MKYYITLFLLFTASSVLADGRLNTFGRIGDERYSTSISYEQLQKSTDWKPSDGKTRIGQLDALEQARKLLKKEFPHFGPHQIIGVTLAESNSGSWLYKVAFLSKPSDESVRAAGGTMKASMLTYFVLLNGETVSPKLVESK